MCDTIGTHSTSFGVWQPVVQASEFPFLHVSFHQKGGGQTVLKGLGVSLLACVIPPEGR